MPSCHSVAKKAQPFKSRVILKDQMAYKLSSSTIFLDVMGSQKK
jgi:hypothetical protein